MAAVSYTTNRGKACFNAAAMNTGWFNGDGTPRSAFPSHGNWYYVLIQTITGFSDLRQINNCNDAGVGLTPVGFGYSPVANARNPTNFPCTEDDVNEQALVQCPNLNLTAAGGTIQAAYLALCDNDPSNAGTGGAAAANIVALFDLGGLRQSPDGNPFTVSQLAVFLGKPAGEA